MYIIGNIIGSFFGLIVLIVILVVVLSNALFVVKQQHAVIIERLASSTALWARLPRQDPHHRP